MSEKLLNDWRELCAAASVEEDSHRLSGLVDQIIKRLDQGRLQSEPAVTSQISAQSQLTDRR